MKTRILLVSMIFLATIMAFSQRPAFNLTFSAKNYLSYVQLDSIKVMNRTQGGDTILYWPDTVLSLYYMGILENDEKGNVFQIFQNHPNPVADQTIITMYIPEKDKVNMIVTDMLGRVILKSDRLLNAGYHSFRFAPGSGNLFFFSAQWRGNTSSIKILHAASNSEQTCSLKYLGSEVTSPQLKVIEDIQSFSFSIGDELLYIGYADILQSGILDVPEASETYSFHFATNMPCPETLTVTYEGQVYNTLQLFSQCWLKENLNVGTMIQGNQEMNNNGIIEKYCFNNEIEHCNLHGGLYQWDEMMQYISQPGVQGICPPGWRVPTDEDWKVLEGAVDSLYRIGDPEWDLGETGRGYDADLSLKSNYGWAYEKNGLDLYSFTALPSGIRNYDGAFILDSYHGSWWTSSDAGLFEKWARSLAATDNYGVSRHSSDEPYGFSVRCLRDE